MNCKNILATLILAASALLASAQQTVGQWNLFPIFNSEITNIVKADKKVYYLSAGRLYSYDSVNDETYTYSTRNKLTDVEIKNIYRNDEGGYLLIAYQTGNIDLLYDDGRVVNLGDIAVATVAQSKTVTGAAFHKGKIYVSTGFGLVIFNESTHTVEQSGIYNLAVKNVAIVGDRIVILIERPSQDYYGVPMWANVGDRINNFSAFKLFKRQPNSRAQNLAAIDNVLFGMREDTQLFRLPITWENNDIVLSLMPFYCTQAPFVNGDGSITAIGTATRNGSDYYIKTFGSDGQELSSVSLPEVLWRQYLSFEKGLDDFWGLNGDGLGRYRLDNSGSVTVLAEKSRPVATSVNNVAYITGSKDGSHIYVSNMGATRINPAGVSGGTDGTDRVQTTDCIINGVPHDAAAFEAEMTIDDRYQKAANSTRMFGGTQRLAVDPENPNRYVIGNFIEGVFVIENNEVVGRFNIHNMPSYIFWGGNRTGAMSLDVNFDPQGNLWVGNWVIYSDYANTSPYVVLPRAKFQGDLSKVTVNDWMKSKHMGVDAGEKDMGSIFSTRSNYFFTWHSKDSNPLGVTDTRGTYANTADDKFWELESTRDQDGNEFRPQRWVCAVEDKRGRLWFGTSNGPVEITDPSKVGDANFTFTRLKVPRNDGTNYADYLLESDHITSMAVDGLNRKWIATQNSGVYLVSENGDAILEHFTAENSDLPSNTVTAVYCDPNSNVVYFGLTSGLVSYNSTSSPGAENYNDVYAYPNPVKPDYNGWITIKGLMENSLVKIADAAGNVFLQTRSEGGMVVWDGCNPDGQRVRSGVYFVYASQNENGNASACVTKILVVN